MRLPTLFGICILASGGLATLAHPGKPPKIECKPCELDKWLEDEEHVALRGVLDNIGPDGKHVKCHHKGDEKKGECAGPGIVIASPSKHDPDYFYTWTRDAAVVLQMLVDEHILGNASLVPYIEGYIHSQAILQTVSSPSGSLLPRGLGLGEPKFNANSTKFNMPWGRPQRDGPALRAISLIKYCKHLVHKGQQEKAKKIVWPIIQNDLSFIGEYWNQTGFDLWEEVLGSSFFTIQNQHRALIEGKHLARDISVKCIGCDQAPNLLEFLQHFWNGKYIDSNINADEKRSGLDGNSILGSISAFDIEASCDAPTFQPCNSKALANFKGVVDSFRQEYDINKDTESDHGVAIGRYKEDVYQGGNPWYLTTFAAAEFLYDAVAQWEYQKEIYIDSQSLPFFKDIYPDATTGRFPAKGGKDGFFAKLCKATRKYADSFVMVAREYTPNDGSLSEQFDRSTGEPASAEHLTWSYASFLTMARRREGSFPPSWLSSESYLPGHCGCHGGGSHCGKHESHKKDGGHCRHHVECHGGHCKIDTSYCQDEVDSLSTKGKYGDATGDKKDKDGKDEKDGKDPKSEHYNNYSTPGVYKPAIAAGAPDVQGPCQVKTRFEVSAPTYFGESILVIGNVKELGNWNPAKAFSLDSNEYKPEHPIWRGTLFLDAKKNVEGKKVRYHYVRKQGDKYVKENVERHFEVKECGTKAVTLEDEWKGPVVANKNTKDDKENEKEEEEDNDKKKRYKAAKQAKDKDEPMCIMPGQSEPMPLHKLADQMPLRYRENEEDRGKERKGRLSVKERLSCLVHGDFD